MFLLLSLQHECLTWNFKKKLKKHQHFLLLNIHILSPCSFFFIFIFFTPSAFPWLKLTYSTSSCKKWKVHSNNMFSHYSTKKTFYFLLLPWHLNQSTLVKKGGLSGYTTVSGAVILWYMNQGRGAQDFPQKAKQRLAPLVTLISVHHSPLRPV